MRIISKYKNQLTAFLVVVLIITAGVNGYYIGIRHPKTIIVKGIDNIQNGEIKNVDFGTFWQTWSLIKENYLEAKKIKDQDLVYGSAVGLVQSLGDPYSVFLPPDDSKKFADDINGKFGGIGAEIGMSGDFIVVVAPLKNTPAEKAGLKPGDKIIGVDNSPTMNLNINEVVKKIRGPKGSEVVLTILRNGEEKSREIKIIRQTIKVPTLEWHMKEDNIVHIQLFNFNESSAVLLANALNQSLRKGAQGLILDLRNNPGGFLEMAVNIAGIFIERGKNVVIEELGSGKRIPYVAKGNPVLKDFPMVLLINKGSASASEILAGALRDQNKTIVVGENSFGKGTVQELKPLPGGATLKITIAHWLLPNGDLIEKKGIKPDVEVKITEDDVLAGRDPQLKKAIEILKDKISK